MTPDPYDLMQRAVDVVGSSAHETSKVAATLAGRDPVHGFFSLSRTNYWPGLVEARLGREARVGSSSSSVHSEVAVVLHAPYATQGAMLYVTDPFCPNCAKNIVEAGVRAVYIDHKGFDKDWAQRRNADFVEMSLAIMRHAGVSVFKIYRKERRIEPLFTPPEGYVPPQDRPLEKKEVATFSPADFPNLVAGVVHDGAQDGFGVAVARDESGRIYVLSARAHLSIGYSGARDPDILTRREGKYSYVIGPMNRILMGAARHGLRLDPQAIFSAVVPSSRELVNLAGAGITRLQVGDLTRGRDPDSLEAMATLRDTEIMDFIPASADIVHFPNAGPC
jgi:deoxycytidylate deaminase